MGPLAAKANRHQRPLRKNLKYKAANTKTMPIFTINRAQNRFLKNTKSTPTMTAIIATT
jgi:hypothetical protein